MSNGGGGESACKYNFARLTVPQAKAHLWLDNMTIYSDFLAILSDIAQSKLST